MSSNLENDGLVGLKNDDLDCDSLAMVVYDDNYEIMFEGKTYHSYEDYVDSMTTRRSSPLSRPGGTDRSSPAGSLLVSSSDGGNDREDGADSVTAAASAFATSFAPECDDDVYDDDDDIGFVIAESSATIDLYAHLTHKEVMFGVPEVDDFGVMVVECVVFDDVENGTITTSSYLTLIESHNDAKTEEEDDVDEATIGLECGSLVSFECDNLVSDVLVSNLSDSEEMGGMPSLPEPDPIRYFLMDHPLYPELQRLGIRNSMSFVPFATRAKSLEEVEVVIVQHFPPTNNDILYQGIFHSNKDDRMPAEHRGVGS
jgi:hypothetical protein